MQTQIQRTFEGQEKLLGMRETLHYNKKVNL